MIRIDSNKMIVPFDCIDYFNADAYIESPAKKKGGEEIGHASWQINNAIVGLKSIKVVPEAGKVEIETSAKILHDDYFEGININTIERVIESINDTGLISIKEGAIEQARFHSFDTTQNIPWQGRKIDDLFDALSFIPINTRYKRNLINVKEQGKTMIFQGNQKTIQCRMVNYDKHKELLNNKQEKFLQSCKNPNALLNSALGIVRVESRNTEYKTIRNRLQLTDAKEVKGKAEAPRLLSVLNSSVNPNYNLIETITNPRSIQQLEIFERFRDADMKMHDVVRIRGMEGIIEDCAYNIELIRAFAKKIDAKNYDRWLNGRNGKIGFETLLAQMLSEKNAVKSFYIDSIKHYKELVRCA